MFSQYYNADDDEVYDLGDATGERATLRRGDRIGRNPGYNAYLSPSGNPAYYSAPRDADEEYNDVDGAALYDMANGEALDGMALYDAATAQAVYDVAGNDQPVSDILCCSHRSA